MSDEPFSHRADVPEDVRRNVRRLVAVGSEGVVEADNFRELYKNLERLGLREGVLKIGTKAFYDCNKLSRVDSPSSLRSIANLAFSFCMSLCEMNLPEGLESIGRLAFAGNSFQQITIPSSVRDIGAAAFAHGKNLNKVTLAGGTVLVGRNTFGICDHLQNIATPSKVIVVEEGGYRGNGRAEVVTGGMITNRRQEPTRLILSSPYLASMQSADVVRVKDAIDQIAGAGQIRSRFLGLLYAMHRIAGGRPPRGEDPLDPKAGGADDWNRVCEGAEQIRSRFLGLLSAHRRALGSILERAPPWELDGRGFEPGVVEIILSFLGDVEG